jgi:hypothetical protein
MSKLGFTGTRRGMTEDQKESVRDFMLIFEPDEFIHGGCVGADEEAARIASELGIWTNELPGNILWYRTQFRSNETHFPQHPLKRNRVIVRTCDYLLACPFQYEEIRRSGTWATIRYARELGKPMLIIQPQGLRLKEVK